MDHVSFFVSWYVCFHVSAAPTAHRLYLRGWDVDIVTAGGTIFVGGRLYRSTLPVIVLGPAGRVGRVQEVDTVGGTSGLTVSRDLTQWREI